MLRTELFRRLLGPVLGGMVVIVHPGIVSGLFAAEKPVASFFTGKKGPVFKPIPGKAVGVVVLEPKEVLAMERRSGKDAAAFSYNSGSYRWFYVPAEGSAAGEAQTFHTGTTGEKIVRLDGLVLATPQALEFWRVRAPYTLVEVEVNGGEGSGPEESFAATDLKVLDESTAYPLNVSKAVRELDRTYRAHVKKRQAALESKMEEAQKTAREKEQGSKAPGKREKATIQRVYVTWLPDTERLVVEFRTRQMEGEYSTGKGIVPGGPNRSRESVPPVRSTGTKGIRYGAQWGVETGTIYEVLKTGNVELSRDLAVETFFEQGALPQ